MALPGATLMNRSQRRNASQPVDPDDENVLRGPAITLDILVIYRSRYLRRAHACRAQRVHYATASLIDADGSDLFRVRQPPRIADGLRQALSAEAAAYVRAGP